MKRTPLATVSSLAICFGFILQTAAARAQTATTTPASDPQAIALAVQAVSALVGTTQVADATLTGTAIRSVGSDVGTGTITLKVLGNSDSRLDMNLSDGTRSEI